MDPTEIVTIDNDDKPNNIVYYGYTVPGLCAQEWLRDHVFWCACGYRITNFVFCLKCKATIILAADEVTVRALETDAEYDAALRWTNDRPFVNPSRRYTQSVANANPKMDTDDLVWKALRQKRPIPKTREKLKTLYALGTHKLFAGLLKGYWRTLFEHMSHWESRAEYRKACTTRPHPAARSGLWDIPAGDQLSFLQHNDDNTIWKVPECDRLYSWIPSGPYEYNVQFRDIFADSSGCSNLLWPNTVDAIIARGS